MSGSKGKKETVSEQVKVVLRRLPKHMTEKEVLEQISPLPEEIIGTYFRPANFSFDRSAFATMTLLFSEYCDSLVDFERRFDGYIFVDSRGNDSAAVVEAAVNQHFAKCDRARMAEDNRVGAILTDKYYLEFCEKLEKEKATPVMTLEQQIKRLGKSDDARTQIDRLETPLVKYFFEKEAGKRQQFDSRKTRRDEKRAAIKSGKNIMDILIKPSIATTSSVASTSSAPPAYKKEPKEPMTEREKEKMAKFEAKRKERDALRKQKFLEEKKRKRAERDLENNQEPRKDQPPRENKKKERTGKPPRPSPAKTLSEQQGEDWIKKLTDPKASIKKKHDLPVPTKLNPPKVIIMRRNEPTPPISAAVPVTPVLVAPVVTEKPRRPRHHRPSGKLENEKKGPPKAGKVGPKDENRKPRV